MSSLSLFSDFHLSFPPSSSGMAGTQLALMFIVDVQAEVRLVVVPPPPALKAILPQLFHHPLIKQRGLFLILLVSASGKISSHPCVSLLWNKMNTLEVMFLGELLPKVDGQVEWTLLVFFLYTSLRTVSTGTKINTQKWLFWSFLTFFQSICLITDPQTKLSKRAFFH